MKKLIGFLTVLSFMFFSCSLDELEKDYNVFDDDNAIINNRDHYLQKGSVMNNRENIFSQRVTGFFTGLKTIRTLNGQIKFNVDLKITSGRLKLVLVSDDKNDLVLVCNENSNKIFEFPELEGKKYKLKMVGDHATFDLNIKY